MSTRSTWSSLLCLAIVLLSLSAAHARPNGGEVTFQSKALGGRQSYVVWLPPSHAKAEIKRPLVVLLHGLGGAGSDWFDPTLGALGPALATAIESGVMPEVIVVAPNGKNGYWTDHLTHAGQKGPAAYGAFIDEVITDAEARYGGSGVRAIVGASMGGHGALSRALMAPSRYAAVVSMAGALFPEPPTHRKIYKQVWGDPASPEHWAKTAPMALMRGLSKSIAPPIFLHCGKDDRDRFLAMTMTAAERLRSLEIPFELVLSDGGHGWTTWRGVTDRWLAWLGPHLKRSR